MNAQSRHAQPGRTLLALVVGFAILLGAFGIAWYAAPPEVQGLILLAGLAAELMLVIGGYAIVSRRHFPR